MKKTTAWHSSHACYVNNGLASWVGVASYLMARAIPLPNERGSEPGTNLYATCAADTNALFA